MGTISGVLILAKLLLCVWGKPKHRHTLFVIHDLASRQSFGKFSHKTQCNVHIINLEGAQNQYLCGDQNKNMYVKK